MIKSFSKPDNTKELPSGMGRLLTIQFGKASINKAICKPGWRWSEHVRPVAQTNLCDQSHIAMLMVGSEVIEARHGVSDLMHLPRIEVDASDGRPALLEVQPGHDAWITGNQIAEVIDFHFE